MICDIFGCLLIIDMYFYFFEDFLRSGVIILDFVL